MKTITITVEVDGSSVDRSYTFNASVDWGTEIESMLDTLENSNKPFKEIPGFEGTLDKLAEL